MSFKVGCSYHDKNMIRDHYLDGMSVDRISAKTRVKVPMVLAVIEQVEAGKLTPANQTERPQTNAEFENRLDELSAENEMLQMQVESLTQEVEALTTPPTGDDNDSSGDGVSSTE